MREITITELRHRYGDQQIINAAREILSDNVANSDYLNSPQLARQYVETMIGGAEREHFLVVFLNSQHRVICGEIMFSGTLTQTSVYPREVVKRALELNAAAVVLAHNHPSSTTEPSREDEQLTQILKQALALIDVRVLDHLIVAKGAKTLSFAERGLL